jgi:hypothetical protein
MGTGARSVYSTREVGNLARTGIRRIGISEDKLVAVLALLPLNPALVEIHFTEAWGPLGDCSPFLG